jgi:preprotein translocase subunit SecA
MKKILKRVLGDPQAKTIKRLRKRVIEVNALSDKYEKMSDKQLKEQTDKLKDRLKDETLDAILPDAFALVREAAARQVKMRPFDVQLIGGMVLHEGNVAEMKTGEGKTLVATMPVFLNGLTGKGVHVVTVNEYLAQRDAGWMGLVYDFLGLSVSVIVSEESFIYDSSFDNQNHDDDRMRHLKPCTRKEAYEADITYGTNSEFGFDYLRDNMAREENQLRQRELHYAIVDEVDSILIDEARTPLIISGPSVTSGSAYSQFSIVVKKLKRDKHYEVDEKFKTAVLTDDGIAEVQKILGVDSLYDSSNVRTLYHLEQALRAEAVYKRDKNYVVTNEGEVVIVDEFTGRLLPGRRYSEGLHQAIEAKEGVEVQQESMTLATISFQNYFRLYQKLAGMTGTAMTESEEFHQIYRLDVVDIPTNKPMVRNDKTDRIYRTEQAKFRAILKEVQMLYQKGQPVLIGTNSIEKNELVSTLLNSAKIPHQVLNAKNNQREAKIVAGAGQKGAVTLATNIAGRGTDIVLGEGIKDLGGLYVIGTERNESRRVDNQFRGRSGRQGDPGASQFFVSTEDDLMRVFGGDKMNVILQRFGADDDTPIEHRMISKSLEGAQKKVEGYNFDARKWVVQYDDVMNRHRKAVYSMRRQILTGEDISGRIRVLIEDEVKALSSSPNVLSDDFDKEITEVFPFDDATLDRVFDNDVESFKKVIEQEAFDLYDSREAAFSSEIMRQVERQIYLAILDELWMQHLETMQHLREGISLVQVGQRDPLVEYRKRSQVIFDEMQATLRRSVLKDLFRAEPLTESQLNAPVETELTRAARRSVDNADEIAVHKELREEDFVSKKTEVKQVREKKTKIKKARKAERQRKSKSRKKK